jgi:mRNA interferase HigB
MVADVRLLFSFGGDGRNQQVVSGRHGRCASLLGGPLREFIDSLAGSKDQEAVENGLVTWYRLVKTASWQTSADIRKLFATASIISSDRAVFNIKGNDYRLIVAFDCGKAIVWIKWIGSHDEYDKIDAKEVEYGD